jgi:hypothetical protein
MTRNVKHVGQLFPQGAAVRARWNFSKLKNRRFIGIFREEKPHRAKNLTGAEAMEMTQSGPARSLGALESSSF